MQHNASLIFKAFLKKIPWCCDNANCIKLLLISCQIADRWITVRVLSYICPLASFHLCRAVQTLVTYHSVPDKATTTGNASHMTAIGEQHPDWVTTGLTRERCGFQSALIRVNAWILYVHAWPASSFSCGFALTSHSASGSVPRRDALGVCCSPCRT